MVTNKGTSGSNFLSTLLSVFIIANFFIIGPASALEAVFTSPNTDLREGETFEFSIEVDMNTDNRDMPQTVQLLIEDGEGFTSSCEFDISGNMLSCDEKFNSIMVYIDNKQCPDLQCIYGYGYGYGYSQLGDLKFTVHWETPNVDENKEYTVKSMIHTKQDTYEKDGLSFTVESEKTTTKRSRSLNAPLVGVEKEEINETLNETKVNESSVFESSGTGLFANIESDDDTTSLEPSEFIQNPTQNTQEDEESTSFFGALISAGFPTILAFFVMLAIFGFILFFGVRTKA